MNITKQYIYRNISQNRSTTRGNVWDLEYKGEFYSYNGTKKEAVEVFYNKING